MSSGTSLKSGTGHFLWQRVSGIALVVLGLWFIVSLLTLPGLQLQAVLDFIARPLNTALMALLCATVAYHSYLGIEVVIEDYVHGNGVRSSSLLLSKVVHLLVAGAMLYAVLRMGFGT